MEDKSISLRCYVGKKEKEHQTEQEHHNDSISLVIDTETTVDEYQNFKFGSCGIWVGGRLYRYILFYSSDLSDKEKEVIQNYKPDFSKYSENPKLEVMNLEQFTDRVFYPYAFQARCKVVGFNLPFDLSRIASRYSIFRSKKGFSFQLSRDSRNPRILIQSLDSKRSFIRFMTPWLKRKQGAETGRYSGFFVDLRTLLFALTSESHSLDSGAKEFKCEHYKTHAEEHGKITREYIDYNVNDVIVTHELYQKALERYRMFGLNVPENKLFSPATIGKELLLSMGINSLLALNQDFSKDILGYVMTTYYGGRTEVRIRKTPVNVSYLDFTSMYPTMFTLLNLNKFVIAENIESFENTERIRRLVDDLKIEDIGKREFWNNPDLVSIVQIIPKDDILPVRAKYSKEAQNIGVNYLSADEGIWYSLADVVASTILTGKSPEIIRAITFKPVGQQKMKEIELFGFPMNPVDNVIKRLIEKRIEIKTKYKETGEQELNVIQKEMKIIANATSYGIFIEVNRSDQECEVEVHALDSYKTTAKPENPGKMFNPIIATMLTSYSRLILATVEALSGGFAYCDTDSMFVSPESVERIQEFFRTLNPYDTDIEMFKVEDVELNGERILLDNAYFYGISAKRYCLYDIKDGKIRILKHSSHGLGHIQGLDEEKIKEIWVKIIEGSEFSFLNSTYAVSQLSITKPSILNRFKSYNKGKPYNEQIKPFNFIIVGQQKNGMIPMLPYVNPKDGKFKQIPYLPFINYKTGELVNEHTNFYWHRLSDLLDAYRDHPESKSDGEVGHLERKHIRALRIEYIGKESNNLEVTEITGLAGDEYTVYENKKEFFDWILALKIKDAEKIGVSKRTLLRIKKRIRSGEVKNHSRVLSVLYEMYQRS